MKLSKIACNATNSASIDNKLNLWVWGTTRYGLCGTASEESQEGAEVKLYVNTVSDGAGGVNDSASLYIESGISISSMSLSVTPDDPTSAELSFTINDPKNVLGTDLTV